MNKIYMIGNTHFDPVWEWTWDEAMASIRATFRSALDRMNEYPDFCYSFSSPPVFEWIKKTNPDMFEEIRQRVSEGRWDLAEGWWNQPDCFSAMGESYVRQGLYGQRYLMQNFGKYSECVFNTDSFGHPNMLPQILSKSGIKYYCLCRPEESHYQLKSPLFRWKSCDGSEVLAFRIGGKAGEGWAKNTAQTIETADASECDLLMVYGVTDHGGAPTKKSIEDIIAYDCAEFSTVGGYFKKQQYVEYEIEDEFITGDFGVYSNFAAVKQMNRRAEYALLNAEKACVIANENNTEQLTDCWKDVLFNQFHDILGGASIKEAYIDARNLHGRAIQTANEILHFNLQKITSSIKMPGKNPDNIWNLVLWNLNCCEYDGYIEAEVQWAHEFDWYDGGITLDDGNGEIIETQIITEHSAIPRFRTRFIFKAKVPSMGYRCFKVIQNGHKSERKNADFRIETDRFIYTVSKKNGGICELFDKKTNSITAKELLVPTCYKDTGDTWCFNIDAYGEKCGEFSVVEIERIESGDLLDKIKVSLRYNNSMLYLYYKFYKHEAFFDVDYTVNWNESHTVFKLNFRTQCDSLNVSSPYGQMKRGASKRDKPMGEWLKAGNMLLISKSNFAYNFYDDVLGITVLRSPVYGDFRLGELPEKYDMIMEQGITEGSIRVMQDAEDRSPVLSATCFNNPPVVICESNHDGTLPGKMSYLSMNAEYAMIGAVKYAEDGNGVIVRISDYSGKAQQTILSVFGKQHTVQLDRNEIKTLLITDDHVVEVNMIEIGEI